MQRLCFSVLTLFALLTPLHLAAQEAAITKTTTTMENGEVTSVTEEYFEPPPSTIVKLIQLSMEAEMQGKMLFIHLERSEDSADLIGITEPQKLHIEAKGDEIQKRMEALEETHSFETNDWSKLPPDELEARENKIMDFLTQALDDMDTRVRETLTPIQLQAAREYQLANPTFMGMPIESENVVNLDAYEALDLSEEQKKQLKEVQEETKAEYKKAFEKLKNDPNIAKDPEKLLEILGSDKMKAFGEKMKAKIDKILTPEQRERLTKIKEDIPKKIAEIQEKKAKEPKPDESWKDSWNPGDPLPEGAVPPPRVPRFPLGR